MVIFPNAKINLGLRITARRPDGYHYIESLMVPVPWHDILEAVPGVASSHSLTITGRSVDCPPEQNLVMKAVSALEEVLQSPLPPSDFFLRKIIPDGAGMGGGSADAAFALTLLNSLYSLGLSDDTLAEVASRVGADCPFFIFNKVSAVTGIGTTILPAPDASSALKVLDPIILIAKPPQGVSTREAYAGVSPRPVSGPLPAGIVASLPPEDWEDAGLVNDFETSVMARCPMIGDVKARIKSLGARYTAMTGSGSAVFGIFSRESDILSAPLEEIFPGCDTLVAPLFR